MFYVDLFRTLQEERVDYVFVEGLAINLHGVERATMDVDLVLAMLFAAAGRNPEDRRNAQIAGLDVA